jgi:RNA polymerase sigma-70 factor (ECF subfamily)
MDPAARLRDEWLALRCQSGAPEAFGDLVHEFERPLRYYATKLLRSDERAVDVLQDVWIKAFRGIRKLKDPGSLRPWLYRITLGVATDRIRGDSTRRRVEEPHVEGFEGAVEPGFGSDDTDAIHSALDELDVAHREVLVLHFLEDFSIAETAAALGVPDGTVKSRIYYAKKALKELLERGGYGTEK